MEDIPMGSCQMMELIFFFCNPAHSILLYNMKMSYMHSAGQGNRAVAIWS